MERIIQIKSLELITFLGVSNQEREHAQSLLCDLWFTSSHQPEKIEDELSSTIDYVAVSNCVKAVAKERPRKLLETLADDISFVLLKEFDLRWVELLLQKFILPNTKHVALRVKREAST